MSANYTIGDLIKKGSFSDIYEFKNKRNSKIYAGKVFALEKFKESSSYKIEEKILKSVNHPNIIKFRESFSDDENHYIITDYYPNGNLMELTNRREKEGSKLTEIEIKYYLTQIVSTLIYLKQNNIVHRDIKPHHLVISEDLKLKLCGFHVAKILEFEEDKIKGNSGTAQYKAPELVKNEYYSFEVDVWSLGILLYRLLLGTYPFNGKSKEDIVENIKSGKYSFPNDCDISPVAKDLIRKMLVYNTNNRITIEEVSSHDFLKFGIPNSLPFSTLKEPPSKDFIIKYSQEKSLKVSKKYEEENIILKKKLGNVNNLLLN